MQIILMRHGQAQPFQRDDANRALTAEGELQAQQSAAWLINHGYQIDALFVSPYKRAQQTAYFIAQTFDVPITNCECITPDDDALAAFEWLDDLMLPESATIAMVCHMPIVARLAALLTGESLQHVAGFNLAEVHVIDLDVLALGVGKVTARLVPSV